MKPSKPTYDDYTAWGGAADEATFSAALPAACSRVKQRCATHGLDDLTEGEAKAYANAVCACVDALSSDTAGASGYSAGSISVTFGAAAAASNTVGAAIERELSGTALIGTVLL